jgi:glutathione S-transferase
MTVGMKAYAITVVLLFVKMLANSGVQGYHRIGKKAFAIPEDARFFGGNAPLAQDLPEVQRASAVWRNDLENIPIFLFLAFVYVTVDAPGSAAPAYFGTFVVARFAHMIFYLNAMQPWRFLAFLVGQLACLGLAAQILMRVM